MSYTFVHQHIKSSSPSTVYPASRNSCCAGDGHVVTDFERVVKEITGIALGIFAFTLNMRSYMISFALGVMAGIFADGLGIERALGHIPVGCGEYFSRLAGADCPWWMKHAFVVLFDYAHLDHLDWMMVPFTGGANGLRAVFLFRDILSIATNNG